MRRGGHGDGNGNEFLPYQFIFVTTAYWAIIMGHLVVWTSCCLVSAAQWPTLYIYDELCMRLATQLRLHVYSSSMIATLSSIKNISTFRSGKIFRILEIFLP